jgi:hypothetical protein
MYKKLYGKSHLGTKKLIEKYIREVIQHLNIICDTDSPDFSVEAKFEFFRNTQKSFGRTALLLSGGAVFGKKFLLYFHSCINLIQEID